MPKKQSIKELKARLAASKRRMRQLDDIQRQVDEGKLTPSKALTQLEGLRDAANTPKRSKNGKHWVSDPRCKGGGYWRKSTGASVPTRRSTPRPAKLDRESQAFVDDLLKLLP